MQTIKFPKKKAAAKCTQSRTITCGDNCTGCNPDELLANMINENSEPGKGVLYFINLERKRVKKLRTSIHLSQSNLSVLNTGSTVVNIRLFKL